MGIKNKLNNFLRPFNIQVHGLGYLQSLAKGDFKKDEFVYFKEKFGDKKLSIYDVGANRGLTIDRFIQLFPTAQIIAFEPYPPLVKELKDKYANSSNVIIVDKGVSDKPGELVFYINKSVDTSSFLPSQLTGLNSDAQVKNIDHATIEVTTIQKTFNEYGLDHIDILKLDIQGSELNALKGAGDLLVNKKIGVIYTEAYFIQQYKGQPLFPEIAMFLSNYGFDLQDIYNPIYGKGKLAWCDAVFVKKENE